MTTIQFLNAVWGWLLSDPTHVVVAGSVLAALTPTPKAGSLPAKLYRVLDLLAINFMHAKETGVTPSQIAEEVAALLEAKSRSATSTTKE